MQPPEVPHHALQRQAAEDAVADGRRGGGLAERGVAPEQLGHADGGGRAPLVLRVQLQQVLRLRQQAAQDGHAVQADALRAPVAEHGLL